MKDIMTVRISEEVLHKAVHMLIDMQRRCQIKASKTSDQPRKERMNAKAMEVQQVIEAICAGLDEAEEAEYQAILKERQAILKERA